jgi:hypothetical protein
MTTLQGTRLASLMTHKAFPSLRAPLGTGHRAVGTSGSGR